MKTVFITLLAPNSRFSATATGRDQLEAALRFVRKADVFVVTRLDRLARSMTDLRKIVDALAEKEVGFRVLQQPSTPPHPKAA